MTNPTAREAIARALADSIWVTKDWPARTIPKDVYDACENHADKAIAALKAAGWRIVPEEATEAMVVEGVKAMTAAGDPTAVSAAIFGQPRDIYHAMISAAEDGE